MKTFNSNVEITDQIGNSLMTNTEFAISVEDILQNNVNMQPNETIDAFSGVIALAHDNTTNYSIANVSANTFRLNFVSGVDPIFKTSRAHSGDNTTAFKITKTGDTGVLTHTAGTAFNFATGGFIVGDLVQIRGSEFDTSNQGVFKVILAEEAKIVYENFNAITENVILAQNTNINGFSSAGVQIGNGLEITSGFSSQTIGKYIAGAVTNEYIEFFSANTLPDQGPIQYTNGMVVISRGVKKFIYVVSDNQTEVIVDNVIHKIKPLIGMDGTKYKAQLLTTGEFSSVQVKNTDNQASIVSITVAG